MENLAFVRVGFLDLAKLHKIAVQTFRETFSAYNSKEDLDCYVQKNLSFQNLEIQLENPDSDFYFAIYKDEILGYLKLNFESAQTDLIDQTATEIHRIYVLKEFQKKKGGQFLLDNAIEIAIKKKSAFIWLGVWEKNENAIGFYKKNNFKTFGNHDFLLGSDLQTDLLMKLSI